uniref:RING-type domain-containing protein n=1 Tax=Panagrolaimus sp. PS1159 TaxID=55785 RepID=A0AC35GPI2_9BILA
MDHGHGHDHEVVLRQDGETDEEFQWRKEHAEMHIKHRGHDVMHAEMFLIFLFVLAVAQIILVVWKQRHFKSYQVVTTVGLWFIPFAVSLSKGYWRFIFTWLAFTAMSGYIYSAANQQQISGRTPRRVYKWFLFLHQLSYVLGIGGYLILMATIIGVNLIFNIKTSTSMDWGIYLLFYGLYYGVLGRDFAHICTDRMACKIGYFTHEGLPKKILEEGVCAVCGNHINRNSSDLLAANDEIVDDDVDNPSPNERTYTLSCNHSFHEFCIRGWVVVGKLQTCPYCKEKVDLKRMFKNPWEKPHLFFGQLLDWIRYLVAWQPIIILIVQGIHRTLGLE